MMVFVFHGLENVGKEENASYHFLLFPHNVSNGYYLRVVKSQVKKGDSLK